MTESATPTSGGRRWWVFAAISLAVVGLDQLTKAWALESLAHGAPTAWKGGILPLTLHFNTGGLWGLGSGSLSRWFFPLATLVAVVVLVQIYRSSGSGEILKRFAVPMVAGGAIGNLIDRLRWDRGVVDFIGPFDLGFMVWPIFNVADMAISTCTLLLVFALWREGARHRSQEAVTEAVADAEGH
ncbi:MAG: signal peptidase II [Acidobacteria bacterium]|nr:signal peptidase II [Acidobacteriota bacterium]